MMDALVNSAGVILLGLALGGLAMMFWRQKTLAQARADRLAAEQLRLTEQVDGLQAEMHRLAAMATPINAAFQAVLVKQLTHFHTPHVDALLKKLGPPIVLTPAEAEELVIALRKRETEVDAQIDELERDAARMLPMVMKRVKAEMEMLKTAKTELQIVKIAPVEPPKDDERLKTPHAD